MQQATHPSRRRYEDATYEQGEPYGQGDPYERADPYDDGKVYDDGGPYAYARLRPLVVAEAAAEAAACGVEAADLEQAVWLRLVESGGGPPGGAAVWVRAAVRTAAGEALGCGGGGDGAGVHERPGERASGGVEAQVLAAEHDRALRAVVRGLPGRCPQIVTALMSRSDRTYREISRELGISQGSLGPLRSRCLRCLLTILNSRVGSPVGWGNAR